jgi:hypothetical protein
MPLPVRHSRKFLWMPALVCCYIAGLSGCRPMIMLGKMLQGDPLISDEFGKWNGKSLAKSGKKVAILVSTPESIKTEYASLDIDLLSAISRKLATKDIVIVKPHIVATWIDDHGWDNLDLKELGTDVDADFLIQVKLDHFDFHEENSPNLFRGRTNGIITAYEMKRGAKTKSKDKDKAGWFGSKDDDDKKKDADKDKEADKDTDKTKDVDSKKDKDEDSKTGTSKKNRKKKDEKEVAKRDPVTSTRQVYNRSFQNTYPAHQPVSIEQMQPETFKKKFLDHVSDDLSKLFYAHKEGSGF